MTEFATVKPLSESEISSFGPINLVIIQPTSFCNLDCDYCYLPDRAVKNQLSLDLIDPIFERIFTSPFAGEGLTVCWHAGEPLAMPISFYKSAFALIERAALKYNKQNTQFIQSVQTNATLINQAWCDFFKEYQVDVGVSIDGPAFLHDAHRKTRKGTGTHASAMRGISFLQKNEIPFYVIAVITRESLDYPEEIFNFFMENDIQDVGFNMEETEGVNQLSSLDKSDIEQKYRTFMEKMWDLTASKEGVFKIREFESVCNMIYHDSRLNHTDMNHPFAIVNFDWQGNFSTFDPELLSIDLKQYGKFAFGNVLKNSLESVCSSEKFSRAYQDMKAGVEMCQTNCQYFGICGGGTGSNKYWENGTFNSGATKACKYRSQIITDIILDKLEGSF